MIKESGYLKLVQALFSESDEPADKIARFKLQVPGDYQYYITALLIRIDL
jgi:hypothetical protein